MTEAIPMTPADREYHKAHVPSRIIDEMIADGTFVIVDEKKACENNGGRTPKI
jgi:hypothetical protein